MFSKLLNQSTDKLIAILFTPWLLLAFIPLLPDSFRTEYSLDLFFLILWMQLAMIYTLSYHTLILLNSKSSDKLQASALKFKIHSVLNYLLCTFWLGLIVFPIENITFLASLPFLILILMVSEILRLKTIAKQMVSIELNKVAKLKDYLPTLFLLTSIYGAWNIHQRIKMITQSNTKQ